MNNRRRISQSASSVMRSLLLLLIIFAYYNMNIPMATKKNVVSAFHQYQPSSILHRLPQSSRRRISIVQSATLAPSQRQHQPIFDPVVDNIFNPRTLRTDHQADEGLQSSKQQPQLNATTTMSDIFITNEIQASNSTAASAATISTTPPTTTTRRRKRNMIRKIPSLVKSKMKMSLPAILPAWTKSQRFKSIVLFSFVSLVARFLLKISPITPGQFIQQLIVKFVGDWKTFSMIPFVAAFVGWFTNYLAVQMIFYPIKWRGIPIHRSEGQPLGFIGWQGIIPAKTAKMSQAMVNVTINELLSMEETIQKLDPDQVAAILAPEVPEMVKSVLDDDVTAGSIPPKARNFAKNLIDNNNIVGQRLLTNWLGKSFLTKLTVDMQDDILNLFNVRNCVVNQMMSDRTLLGKLFQKTGGKELKFLVDSGLWFGFLLGIIQMFIALVCDNPWTLSMGGLIVGLLTNWIALKWIFEPIEPMKVGPFTLQGKFLRRQKEVAKDFSHFFARKILNSYEFWKSILYDPTTSPNFKSLFTSNLVDISKKATKGIIGNKPSDVEYLGVAASKACQRLPYHFTRSESFYEYVDTTLGIEKTLRTGLESMSSKQFEQILHPIFEEDELTLILAGGFLGFLAGFGQQLFATGVWTLPSLSMIVPFFKQILSFLPF